MEAILGKLGARIAFYAILALLVSGALFGVYKHIELVGEHKILAAAKAADEKEHARRMTDLETLQQQFASTVDALHSSEKSNADLVAQGRLASRVGDGRTCLDVVAAERLRAIGAPRRQAGDGTAKPAGKAAR
jgi:hypothetical protein